MKKVITWVRETYSIPHNPNWHAWLLAVLLLLLWMDYLA